MPDGGVYALTIPEAPYRCPPGPYERASVIAAYFKRSKPRSKVLVLDANADITSKAGLFKKAWAELYPDMIEYRPQHRLSAVDGKSGTLRFEVQEDVRAQVLNVLPPMRAGEIAVQSGLANANQRWCHVHFLNFESTAVRHVHVLGDAIQAAPGMPKSGHMANAHAKVAAAAIVAELHGLELNPEPMLANACMSFVDDTRAIHVASVHSYNVPTRTFMPVDGAGGLSAAPSVQEGQLADAWARNIWADTLG
jgi:sulfide dehydrogenase [flavocytochrome c] flavoprotein chain